ncbi:MAG: chemotaxis protein CheW [Desulfuromonadales bacterium]|nr:chemotaxis protein CheW [Desulfuromonadales bacterium]
MVQAAAKKLIFRLGEIGFVLDLACIVEICEQIVDAVDLRKTDLDSGIVGSLLFRQTLIPVIDPTLRLELSSSIATRDRVALVLRSSEGNWALLVDQVAGVCSSERFQPCELPPLLKQTVNRCFSQVELLDNEPMIIFEPERYYGSPSIAV